MQIKKGFVSFFNAPPPIFCVFIVMPPLPKITRSGSCLVVMPGCPLTYYPDMSEATPVVVFMLSKILAVLGVKTVYPNMMGPLLAFLIFLLFGVFHFILSYLGI